MSAGTAVEEKPPSRFGMSAVLFAFVGAICGFVVIFLDLHESLKTATSSDDSKLDMPEIKFTYIPIEPVIATISNDQQRFQLKFSAQLEVDRDQAESVSFLMPRIIDVLNTYLRALEPSDLQDELALLRIRTHVLHRINLVVGNEAVQDVLITQFTLD